MKILLLMLYCFSMQQVLAGVSSRFPWRSTQSLSVCFAAAEPTRRELGKLNFLPASWSKTNLQKIQNWIESEYTPERTGIHFYGWSSCQENRDADIVLFFAENGGLIGGQASLGPRNPGTVAGYPAARGYVMIYHLNKATAVHEFGHVAGLMHEHLHPQAFHKNARCVGNFLRSPAPMDPQNDYAEYDAQSVMNYCALNAPGGEDLGLSPGDLSILQRLYL